MKYKFCKNYIVYQEQLRDNLKDLLAEQKKERNNFDREKFINLRKNMNEALRLLIKGRGEMIVNFARGISKEELERSIDNIKKELNLNISTSVNEDKSVTFCWDSPRIRWGSPGAQAAYEAAGRIVCPQIAAILKHPKNGINQFSIAGGMVGDNNFEIIAGALRDKNNKVTEMNIYESNLGPAGAKIIADIIKNANNKLKKLRMVANNIGLKGCDYIIEALGHENCDLDEILFESGDVGDKELEALKEIKKIRPELKITVGKTEI